MVEPYKPIYTVKEVAKILKVNPSKVYELIRAGKLICLRLGQIKIRGSDLEQFIMTYPAEKIEEDT
ncbi:helix-turn-helix domain-containing protein [Enterocloster citroniae]|uniref:helix-turn-helix domain-containing protein n=1 Tax=Enterocloster citroniae TaxID=358743 RepID=UPI0034A41FF4